MQFCFYCRLPIVQAGTFALLVPTLSFLNLPEWQCSKDLLNSGQYAVFVIIPLIIILIVSEVAMIWQSQVTGSCWNALSATCTLWLCHIFFYWYVYWNDADTRRNGAFGATVVSSNNINISSIKECCTVICVSHNLVNCCATVWKITLEGHSA